jgi:hypothetical protein
MINAHNILVGNFWEPNTKMDLKEVWCEGVDWIYLSQYRIPWRGPVDPEINFCIHEGRTFLYQQSEYPFLKESAQSYLTMKILNHFRYVRPSVQRPAILTEEFRGFP